MLRKLHSLPGLIAALLLVVLAVSGVLLSLEPARERLGATVPTGGEISVAMLAARVGQHYPGVEQIQRTASGAVIVYYSQEGRTGADRVDPRTGSRVATYAPSTFSRSVKKLHRSLFLDKPGRAASGIAALVMLLLTLSGAALLAKRAGGWRRLLRPLHGRGGTRWHAEAGRLALAGLLLSSVTGIYMSAATFGLVPDGAQSEPDFPQTVSSSPALPVAQLPALRAVDLNDLRELAYPFPGDPAAVYSLRTARGDGYVDQASGALLSFQAQNQARRVYELIYRLHTGEGLWWLGLLLGASALSVPLLSVTGTLIWWRRRSEQPRIEDNSESQAADTVILVGSESNSTWGFARTLHNALCQAGLRVHTASMNQLAATYPKAARLFILTATYGDGAAPASASQFLERLPHTTFNKETEFAVLGFGDRQFPRFCQFARDVEAALLAHGCPRLLALDTIDRQSPQEFARWGNHVGELLGHELTLLHTPQRPRTHRLQLLERTDYGEQVQAPTSILRFTAASAPRHGWRALLSRGDRLPRFEAGDLVGIVPPGSPVPRFYSLASSSRDGVLEICVRKLEGGLCSSFLHGLAPGAQIEAFIQPNPDFRPAAGKAPIILIGAGTGIGPLAGFIRHNQSRYPMHLYWGGRNPASDFLYERELKVCLDDRRLTRLEAAFSRIEGGGHVQERLLADAAQLRQLIEKGAQILVCGSRAMADNVMQALNDVLAPLNLDVPALKAQGRYREDVY